MTGGGTSFLERLRLGKRFKMAKLRSRYLSESPNLKIRCKTKGIVASSHTTRLKAVRIMTAGIRYTRLTATPTTSHHHRIWASTGRTIIFPLRIRAKWVPKIFLRSLASSEMNSTILALTWGAPMPLPMLTPKVGPRTSTATRAWAKATSRQTSNCKSKERRWRRKRSSKHRKPRSWMIALTTMWRLR